MTARQARELAASRGLTPAPKGIPKRCSKLRIPVAMRPAVKPISS